MVIGTHIINDDALHPRISVQLGITLPVQHRQGVTAYLKPVVGIELDVPPETEPEEFMDCLEQFLIGKLDEYMTDLNKWSKNE